MNPFATREWQRVWWAHFGTGELELVGSAALQRRGDEVRLIGSREVTDYPCPDEPEAAAAIVAALRPRDTLDAENARREFADALVAAARADGRDVGVEPDESVAVLTLPASWDAYLAGLPRHARHELERKRRRAAATRVAAGDLDVLFAFMRGARGEKGTFLTPPIEAFLREALTAARIDVLELEGRPLAATVGFQDPRTYFLYNMGFDAGAAWLSPGIVLLSALVERAIGEGCERFDFMRGLEHYKLQFGAEPVALMRIRVGARPGAARSGH